MQYWSGILGIETKESRTGNIAVVLIAKLDISYLKNYDNSSISGKKITL